MSPKQEDRGVESESEDIMIAGDSSKADTRAHIEDATGRPAAAEDDLAGD